MADNDNALQQQHRALMEKNQILQAQMADVLNRQRDCLGQIQALMARNAALISQNKTQTAEIKTLVAENDSQSTRMEHSLRRQERFSELHQKHIDALEMLRVEQNARIQEQNDRIAKQDSCIKKQTDRIEEQDDRITEQDTCIKKQEYNFGIQRTKIQLNEEYIMKQDDRITEQGVQILQLEKHERKVALLHVRQFCYLVEEYASDALAARFSKNPRKEYKLRDILKTRYLWQRFRDHLDSKSITESEDFFRNVRDVLRPSLDDEDNGMLIAHPPALLQESPQQEMLRYFSSTHPKLFWLSEALEKNTNLVQEVGDYERRVYRTECNLFGSNARGGGFANNYLSGGNNHSSSPISTSSGYQSDTMSTSSEFTTLMPPSLDELKRTESAFSDSSTSTFSSDSANEGQLQVGQELHSQPSAFTQQQPAISTHQSHYTQQPLTSAGRQQLNVVQPTAFAESSTSAFSPNSHANTLAQQQQQSSTPTNVQQPMHAQQSSAYTKPPANFQQPMHAHQTTHTNTPANVGQQTVPAQQAAHTKQPATGQQVPHAQHPPKPKSYAQAAWQKISQLTRREQHATAHAPSMPQQATRPAQHRINFEDRGQLGADKRGK